MASINAISKALDHVLEWEGGFVDHPMDKGGPTNYGITRTALAEWLGVPEEDVTVDQIKSLTRDKARQIYHALYIERWKIHKLPDEIILPVVDTAVLFGPQRAIMMLQTALQRLGQDIKVDGFIGPLTLSAVSRVDKLALSRMIVVERIGRHVDVLRNDPGQLIFAYGWFRRAISLMG